MMASESSDSQPTKARDTSTTDEPVVNLQVLSPSAGVNRPLLFPDLPAATTIKQLKERIREALPLRPSDENQRLIHRGRALLRESDSLLDIFGADALRIPDRQTIHLVIPDSLSASSAPTTARGPSPASAGHTPAPLAQHGVQIAFGPQPPPGFTRRTHSQPAVDGAHNSRIPSPAPIQPHAHADPAVAFQQHHQNLTNWLSQIQRDAMTRAIVHQNQRGRAQMGMRGIGDTGGGPNAAGGNPADTNTGRAVPPPTQTWHRETVGPTGHSYHQVESVMRSGTPIQQSTLSPLDVQTILRGADANQATAAMTSAMQRSASGASIHGRPLNQPGVTTPIFPPSTSTAGSGRATPDLSARSALGAGQVPVAPGPQTIPTRPQPMDVYILASPEGPRALLLNRATTESYYTPRPRFQPSIHPIRTPPSLSNVAYATALPQTPAQGNHQQHPPEQRYGPQQQQRNRADAVNDRAPAPAAGQAALHPGNPPAAGIPPLLLQAWPHVWLIFRLAVFVWLFTSPQSSWTRWFTVICLAVLVFLLSTGILNGVAENAWRPIGRHVENLLPTPEQHVRRQQRLLAEQAVPGQQQRLLQQGELDPAQMAARIVAERAGQSWFTAQVRRLERAGLLFLASIAPGITERHIANLEAETRAEEARRREAAAVAAAAATSSATEAENNISRRDDGQNDNETSTHNQAQEANAHGSEGRGEPRENIAEGNAREELIAL